jgi:hypothetical protein
MVYDIDAASSLWRVSGKMKLPLCLIKHNVMN